MIKTVEKKIDKNRNCHKSPTTKKFFLPHPNSGTENVKYYLKKLSEMLRKCRIIFFCVIYKKKYSIDCYQWSIRVRVIFSLHI